MPDSHSKHRPAKWRLFPATRTLAFYDTLAQYIELSEVESSDLAAALDQESDDPLKSIVPLPLLYHELRHWIDHLATVWGRQRLVTAFNAINARKLNQPDTFWRIAEYMRRIDRDAFGQYYETIEQKEMTSGDTQRWMFQFTCGQRFTLDGRLDPQSPIFFTRYAWSDGTSACRVPFSIGSLLETAAMHTEIGIENAIVARLDRVPRMIEAQSQNERRTNALYDAELAVYSTAVHTVANRMDIFVAGDAFPLASALASFCLNLPDVMFDKLIVPDEFLQWGEFNSAALKNRDRGYAYLLLLYHADKNSVSDPVSWVQEAANNAGLPSFAEITAAAKAVLDSLSESAIDGPHRDRLERLIGIGNGMFRRLGISFTVNNIASILPNLTFPPVLCADQRWHTLGPATKPYDSDEVEKWCFECIELERQFEEFMSVCGR
jgi:hypothetical protein